MSASPDAAAGKIPSSPQTSASNANISRGPSFGFIRRNLSREHHQSDAARLRQQGMPGSGTVLTNTTNNNMPGASGRDVVGFRRTQSPRLPSYHALPEIRNSFVTNAPESNIDFSNLSVNDLRALGVNPNPSAHRTFLDHVKMDKKTSADYYVPFPSPSATDDATPVPTTSTVDLDSRTESMTNRGRYNYFISPTANVDGGRRIRRKKEPTPFNVLVVGTKASGKTSFINFLQKSLARPPRIRNFPVVTQSTSFDERPEAHPSFPSSYVEIDHDGEKLGVNLLDSKGLEKHIVDLQIRELTTLVESKFQQTFNEEQKLSRAAGAKDTHIHCVLLFLDPVRLVANIELSSSHASKSNQNIHVPHPRTIGCLDEELDVAVINALQGKTTVIPVISKADTMTTAHMTHLKRHLIQSFKAIHFDPIQSLDLEPDSGSDYSDDDPPSAEEDKENAVSNGDADVSKHGSGHLIGNESSKNMAPTGGPVRNGMEGFEFEDPSASTLPFSILSPDLHEADSVGRRFAWGFADPQNPVHCDFMKLKDLVFFEWETELRAASRVHFYEEWRTNRLKKRSSPSTVVRNVSNATSKGTAVLTQRTASGSEQRITSGSTIGLAIDMPTTLPESGREAVNA